MGLCWLSIIVFSSEIDFRVAKFYKAFWGYRKFLINVSISLHRRFKLLENLAKASLFWCSGSWTLTKRDLQLIRTTQTDMSVKLIDLRKSPDETVGQFQTDQGNPAKKDLHLDKCEQFVFYLRAVDRQSFTSLLYLPGPSSAAAWPWSASCAGPPTI